MSVLVLVNTSLVLEVAIGIEATKVREQGIRFWDKSIFWHEIILKV